MRYCTPLLGLMLAGGLCLAQDMAELEVDHNVNSEFITPHTAWATPYALGKARVLFFLDGRGTNPREVIELKQRFDFEPRMVFWARIIDSTQEHWHGGERGVQRMTRLLTEKWDAFVFMDTSLDKVPLGSVQRVVVTSVLPQGQQAVKLRVKRPDGSRADWADTVAVADKQGVAADVPVAYNDPKGTWTVEAAELYTGTTATARFTVQ